MIPEYGKNIIVGVIRQQKFNWYVTEKLLWFLDFLKYCKAFDPSFTPDKPSDVVYRFHIFVVDSEHEDEFFRNIEPYKMSCKELRDLLKACQDDFDRDGFHASLLVDFDKRHLISYYPEADPFDRFVPDGWTSEYCPFEKEIPRGEQYWIDEDQNNLLD